MPTYALRPIELASVEAVRRDRRDEFGNHALDEVVALTATGYPCRVCLRDAAVGERLLLYSYSPFSKPTAYRTVGPIFVHLEPCEPVGALTAAIRRRLLSVRSYDVNDSMKAGEVLEGEGLEAYLDSQFLEGDVRSVHVYNARAGCFLCAFTRCDENAGRDDRSVETAARTD